MCCMSRGQWASVRMAASNGGYGGSIRHARRFGIRLPAPQQADGIRLPHVTFQNEVLFGLSRYACVAHGSVHAEKVLFTEQINTADNECDRLHTQVDKLHKSLIVWAAEAKIRSWKRHCCRHLSGSRHRT